MINALSDEARTAFSSGTLRLIPDHKTASLSHRLYLVTARLVSLLYESTGNVLSLGVSTMDNNLRWFVDATWQMILAAWLAFIESIFEFTVSYPGIFSGISMGLNVLLVYGLVVACRRVLAVATYYFIVLSFMYIVYPLATIIYSIRRKFASIGGYAHRMCWYCGEWSWTCDGANNDWLCSNSQCEQWNDADVSTSSENSPLHQQDQSSVAMDALPSPSSSTPTLQSSLSTYKPSSTSPASAASPASTLCHPCEVAYGLWLQQRARGGRDRDRSTPASTSTSMSRSSSASSYSSGGLSQAHSRACPAPPSPCSRCRQAIASKLALQATSLSTQQHASSPIPRSSCTSYLISIAAYLLRKQALLPPPLSDPSAVARRRRDATLTHLRRLAPDLAPDVAREVDAAAARPSARHQHISATGEQLVSFYDTSSGSALNASSSSPTSPTSLSSTPSPSPASSPWPLPVRLLLWPLAASLYALAHLVTLATFLVPSASDNTVSATPPKGNDTISLTAVPSTLDADSTPCILRNRLISSGPGSGLLLHDHLRGLGLRAALQALLRGTGGPDASSAGVVQGIATPRLVGGDTADIGSVCPLPLLFTASPPISPSTLRLLVILALWLASVLLPTHAFAASLAGLAILLYCRALVVLRPALHAALMIAGLRGSVGSMSRWVRSVVYKVVWRVVSPAYYVYDEAASVKPSLPASDSTMAAAAIAAGGSPSPGAGDKDGADGNTSLAELPWNLSGSHTGVSCLGAPFPAPSTTASTFYLPVSPLSTVGPSTHLPSPLQTAQPQQLAHPSVQSSGSVFSTMGALLSPLSAYGAVPGYADDRRMCDGDDGDDEDDYGVEHVAHNYNSDSDDDSDDLRILTRTPVPITYDDPETLALPSMLQRIHIGSGIRGDSHADIGVDERILDSDIMSDVSPAVRPINSTQW